MKIPRLIPITLLAFLAFVLTVVIAQSAEIRVKPSPTANSDPPALFTPVQSTGRGGISPTDPTVIRQRSVTANTSLITRTRGSTLTLNLFDDVSYPVVIERVEEQPATSASTGRSTGRSLNPSFSPSSFPIKFERNPEPVLVQFGRVRNTPQSEVYLVSSGDTLSATVRLPDGKLYDVNPTSTNTHVIREINPAGFPPDEPPGWERKQRSSSRGVQRPKQTTYEVLPQDGRLNVLVLYTPKVRQVLGNAQKVRLFLSKVLEQTNQGYGQSGVKLRVNVPQLGEVNYAESGNAEQDLESLSQAAIANKWRQQAKVDVISLWVSTIKDACGIAGLNQTPADFQKKAFNVVRLDCAMNNFSFAHELGHNLGSCHDRETDKTCVGSFPYSYGYQDSEGDFRTIMSYPCAANKDCPRLNYWSSPDLVVNDKKPMGVADQVDNARSLNHVT